MMNLEWEMKQNLTRKTFLCQSHMCNARGESKVPFKVVLIIQSLRHDFSIILPKFCPALLCQV